MKRTSTAAIIGAALALGACGGDDGDGAPSKAEYLKRADAFCKNANAQSRRMNTALQTSVRGISDDRKVLARIAPQLREGETAQRRQVKGFAAIEPSKEGATDIRRLQATFRQQTTIVTQLAQAAEKQDVQRFTLVSRQQTSIRERAKGLARGIGLKQCANGDNVASRPRD